MTRDDVAHLLIRAFALWLGATTLIGIVMISRVTPPPGSLGHAELLLLAAIPLVLAVVVWLMPRPLIRAMFVRPDDVPFALTARAVPALACFVVGLMAIADALPEAVSWIAMQYMLSRAHDPGFGAAPWADSVLQRSVGTIAGMVARLAVGVVLLALSRRPDFWPIPDAESAEPLAPPPAADA